MRGCGINWVDNCSGAEDSAIIQTAAGKFALYARGPVLLRTAWVDRDCLLKVPESDWLNGIVRQIDEYWQDGGRTFDVALLKQGTDFRNRVWRELLTIPVGETVTYSDLAESLATGARAVGSACRHNPFPVIIPCHRVISSSGLGGYAGQLKGKMCNVKQILLTHER